MNKIRLAFLGGGFVGQIGHIVNYTNNPECELTAICEIKPELREELKRQYGFKKAYACHEDLLSDADVDAVVSILRRPNTGPLALEILKSGKHLLTEKPMCHTVSQGIELVTESRRQNLVYSVGYMRRHDEGIQLAKELIDGFRHTGELGSLNFVRLHCFGGESYCGLKPLVTSDEEYPSVLPEWPLKPDWLAVGLAPQYARFLNVYCHTLNLMRYLAGDTPKVSYVNLDNPSGGLVVFDFGQYQASFEAGTSASLDWDEEIEFFFDSGRVKIKLPPAFLMNQPAHISFYRHSPHPVWSSPQPSWTWSFKRQADAFVQDVIKQKNSLLVSAEDGLIDLKLVETIWKLQTLANRPKTQPVT